LKLEIKYVATADLIPYARNAKTHPPEQISQIAGSLRGFGFLNPVIVDKELSIIAGHGRVLAAQKLGLDEVPTLSVEHLTPTQVKAFRLADNRIAQNGDWDKEILGIELIDLKDLGVDLSDLGFDLDDAEIEPPDVPEPSDAPAKYELRVEFDDDQSREEIFLELRDRGYKVKV